jgi:hypothetical protein
MKNVRVNPKDSVVAAAEMAARLGCRLTREWRDGRLVVTLERTSTATRPAHPVPAWYKAYSWSQWPKPSEVADV